ncbi:MAG: MBL fold metallo-hydrolase [Micromonosporaceae bacterium]
MPEVYEVGAVSVRALTDAVGHFFEPAVTAFPDATDAAWRSAREHDPDAFDADGRWRLRFRCFLVTAGASTILVDAGIGPAEAPASAWAPVPGRLPEELAAAEINPDDVDVVVLTHLHTDHVGWAVDYAARQPYFRNARYVLQRVEYDVAPPEHQEQILAPLRAADQLQLVDGSASLAPGVRAEHAPGHTPGHQVVLVDDGGETMAITGDAFVHAIQVTDPSVLYALEADPVRAHATRLDLLSRTAVLATAHLTDPFLRVGGATGAR